ncbi:hypothetical protein BY996DRAFT_8555303 [Phakopsora pachyrhizi]|nr:hypothetical protein BY996DRAFT_8555303 [Phakopsora pachyrhizi]
MGSVKVLGDLHSVDFGLKTLNKEHGGEDHELWLKMNVISYLYHLSFFHGINNTDDLPFSPPSKIRLAKRGYVAANKKTALKEGLCHQLSFETSKTSGDNTSLPLEVEMLPAQGPDPTGFSDCVECNRLLGAIEGNWLPSDPTAESRASPSDLLTERKDLIEKRWMTAQSSPRGELYIKICSYPICVSKIMKIIIFVAAISLESLENLIFIYWTRQSGASSYPTPFCSKTYNYLQTGDDSTRTQSFYGGSYNTASAAPTCDTSGFYPRTIRAHPSVAAQRASAGRI